MKNIIIPIISICFIHTLIFAIATEPKFESKKISFDKVENTAMEHQITPRLQQKLILEKKAIEAKSQKPVEEPTEDFLREDEEGKDLRLNLKQSLDTKETSTEQKLENLKKLIQYDFRRLTQHPALKSAFEKVMGDATKDISELMNNIHTMNITDFQTKINTIQKKINLPSEITLSKRELNMLNNQMPQMIDFLQKIQKATGFESSPDKQSSMQNIDQVIIGLQDFDKHNVQYNIIDEAAYKLSRIFLVVVSPFVVVGAAFVGAVAGAVAMPFYLMAQNFLYGAVYAGTGGAFFFAAMGVGAIEGGYKGIKGSIKMMSTGFENLNYNEKNIPRRTVQFGKEKRKGMINELRNFNAKW